MKTDIPKQPSIPPMPPHIQLQSIQKCKYLLPCGICDKSGKMCSQYGEIIWNVMME